MAKDVDAALRTIVQEHGGKSVEDANEYVEKLKSDKRYKRDVYRGRIEVVATAWAVIGRASRQRETERPSYVFSLRRKIRLKINGQIGSALQNTRFESGGAPPHSKTWPIHQTLYVRLRCGVRRCSVAFRVAARSSSHNVEHDAKHIPTHMSRLQHDWRSFSHDDDFIFDAMGTRRGHQARRRLIERFVAQSKTTVVHRYQNLRAKLLKSVHCFLRIQVNLAPRRRVVSADRQQGDIDRMPVSNFLEPGKIGAVTAMENRAAIDLIANPPNPRCNQPGTGRPNEHKALGKPRSSPASPSANNRVRARY